MSNGYSEYQDEFDIHGLTVQQARDYVLRYAAAVNLDRKKVEELQENLRTWKKREQLAIAAGDAELSAAAHASVAEIESSLSVLRSEITHLSNGVEKMKRDIPGLAARERSVNPDILEQELRLMSGSDMTKPENDGRIDQLEKNEAANDALAALKKKMGME